MDNNENTPATADPKSYWNRLMLALSCTAAILLIGPVIIFSVQILRAYVGLNQSAEYVAMGSSFAAGPGISPRDPYSFYLCARSGNNYAHEFARATHLTLLDVTCSGATSDNILSDSQLLLPVQIDAVHKGAKLVTVTVGGNDASYISFLVASACQNRPGNVPLIDRLLGICRAPSEHDIGVGLNALPGKLYAIVNEINRRAPAAHVVLVDYVTVLPSSGTCAALGLTVAQADRARAIGEQLRLITSEVSRSTGASLVQASELTRGHDVCSSDPWVNGIRSSTSSSFSVAAPYHPRQQAMHAICVALEQFWRSAHLSSGETRRPPRRTVGSS